MRRFFLGVLVTSLLLYTLLVPLYASIQVPVVSIEFNQKPLVLSNPVIVEKGFVYLPIKPMAKLLGLTLSWESVSQTLTMKRNEHLWKVTVGKALVKVDGSEEFMEKPAKLIKGSIYIPGQFLCEIVGLPMIYDSLKQRVSIGSAKATTVPTPVEQTVGTRVNLQQNGSWWGENITKITATATKQFTEIFTEEQGIKRAYLYEKGSLGSWSEGVSFDASRPVNLLADSKGFIHVIGFEPVKSSDDFVGRLFHAVFTKPETIKGEFSKTYLTVPNDSLSDVTFDAVATLFVGAGIGKDDTIAVAYNNSFSSKGNKSDNLGIQVQDPLTGKWQYETIQSNMASRYCYPFAYVSRNYIHVIAIEDQYDPDYLSLPAPHYTYAFRYGAIKAYQRLKTGGPWVETTLIDLNQREGITKQMIGDSMMRLMDVTVDNDGLIHAVVKYNGLWTAGRYQNTQTTQLYHYWKSETQSNWQSEQILYTGDPSWVKLWELPLEPVSYLISGNAGLFITQKAEGPLFKVMSSSTLYGGKNGAPFVVSSRAGGMLNHSLRLVLYPPFENELAKAIEMIVDKGGAWGFQAVTGSAITGQLSLPINHVAPEGGLKVMIFAETLEAGSKPVKTIVIVPEGKSSVAYKIPISSTLRHRVWYELAEPDKGSYSRWGTAGILEMVEYIKKGQLFDTRQKNVQVNLKLIPKAIK